MNIKLNSKYVIINYYYYYYKHLQVYHKLEQYGL